jgi:tripartite motif-containing protein 2/3
MIEVMIKEKLLHGLPFIFNVKLFDAPMFCFSSTIIAKGLNNVSLNSPFFVTIDKNDRIYVSDTCENTIEVFEQNGVWKKTIASVSDKYQLKYPSGIAFNSKGSLVVVDWGNHRLQVFNKKGKFVRAIGSKGSDAGQYLFPRGIAVNTQDNILIADRCNHRIQILNKDGTFKQMIGKEGSGAGEFDHPWDVAVSKASGRIYVSDCGIQVFSPDLSYLFEIGSKGKEYGQFNFPRGLAVSSCGQYSFVCDEGNHRIQVFNASDGQFYKSFGSKGTAQDEFDRYYLVWTYCCIRSW